MPIGLLCVGLDLNIIICYNTIMTTLRISILDPKRATAAGEWCRKNLRPQDWNLYGRNLFTGSPVYDFDFADDRHAMEFALRWA